MRADLSWGHTPLKTTTRRINYYARQDDKTALFLQEQQQKTIAGNEDVEHCGSRILCGKFISTKPPTILLLLLLLVMLLLLLLYK